MYVHLPVSAANREREFIRMLVAASITYEIARACREKLIPDCHCAPSNIPFINRTENKLILAGCNVDMNWAAAYTMLIMNGSNDPLELHNIKVGIEVSAVLEWCVTCKGIEEEAKGMDTEREGRGGGRRVMDGRRREGRKGGKRMEKEGKGREGRGRRGICAQH